MESERLGCRRRGHDWLTLAWNPKTIGLSISRSRVIFVYLCVCVRPFGTLFVKRVTIAKFLKTLGCFRHCAKYSFNPINNPMRLWGSNLYFTDEEIEAQQDCNEPPCHHIAVRWKRLFTWVYQPSFIYSTLNYYTSLMDSSCCSKWAHHIELQEIHLHCCLRSALFSVIVKGSFYKISFFLLKCYLYLPHWGHFFQLSC